MTASAGAWYRVGTVNVVGGSQSIVGVDTNWQNDVIAIAIGDIFTLDAKTWYEVTAVNSNTSITLDRGFEGSTDTNKTYAILRNTSGTILTRIAGQVSVQFNQKQLFLDELRTWLNSDNAVEELTDSHGLKQSLKTPSQMVRDHDNKLAELDAIHPYPYAMRKVEFEARRAANNEKFAASGFVHFGKHFGLDFVNEGLWTNNSFVDYIVLGRKTSAAGVSKTNDPVINIAGVVSKLNSISFGSNDNRIKLPPAEDGTRTYDSTTGISVNHATPAIAFASETDTNKVVTDRVDMWGFEAFLREINDADPFVYAKGLIQSLAPTISGVTTVNDNVRPITYFAWYEGYDDSRGKGVNWQTATEAQRIAIASDPENNIYFDDATGKFYQWCIRGRSFAGLGNGDWYSLEASANEYLRITPSQLLAPQGKLDDNEISFFNRAMYIGYGNKSVSVLVKEQGVFSTRTFNDNESGISYPFDISDNGECHFLVCGTVNRLNRGVYHPSLNPLGTGLWLRGTEDGWLYWYQSAKKAISNISELFTDHTEGGVADMLGGSGQGSIAFGYSGRPDGRYYDAIYASGQGGVCRDMRYSAWGLTPNDFAEADLKVKSGKYRGTESLVFSKPYQCTSQGKVNGWGLYHHDGLPNNKEMWITSEVFPVLDNFSVGDLVSIIYNGGSEIVTCEVRIVYSDRVILKYKGVVSFRVYSSGDQTSNYFITHRSLGLSVSDSFNHTEVMADPANILQCDDLKDGWVGSWNPKIPDGTGYRFPLTRKVINTSDDICFYSDDLGDNWLSTVSAFNLIESSNSVAHPSIFNTGSIVLYQHSASAKYTENAENMPIFGGYDGIGHVIASSDAYALGRGMLLRESLIGKPAGLSSYNNGAVQSMRPNVTTLDRDTLIGATRAAYGPAHDPIVIDGSTSLSGVKALNYNVVEKQQGFIQYAYTEIIFDGDWGDDGKIYIADNQSTRIDDNGNTALYGTARIVEPLGWIKNDK